MGRIFLYAHGGSGNHGCEAIVRSTIQMLKDKDVFLISKKPEEDIRYGVDEICNIIREKSTSLKRSSIDFIKAYASLKIKNDFIPMDKLWYKEAFINVTKDDIALSIGGDNYCYADLDRYIMLHDMLKKRGIKTVLWGCSIEPDIVVRPEVAADLARYDLITARETISYEALKKVNPNTKLVSDPAFILQSKECDLPKDFVSGNTVGINISPMAIEREQFPDIAYNNYKNLMNYIIMNTNMQIALIPHVVWGEGDDRIPLQRLYDEYKQSGRVILVEDHECRELKYLISKCRFFVGARTHSTIAAYSSGIPTLVMGYSVKARGIAKDIFGTENGYVITVQNLQNSEILVNSFRFMMEQEDEIKKKLLSMLPELFKSAFSGADFTKWS